jgi:hypothetical protein
MRALDFLLRAQLELVPSERISVSNAYQATIGVR